MKKFSLFLITVFSLSISAQSPSTPKDSNGKPHGLWQKLHENGKIRYRGRFDHGIPVDTFKYYFEDGQLQTINVFRGKTGNCMSYQYGDKEILAAQGLYLQKQKDSIWTYFNRDQKVIARVTFKKGVQEGKSLKYHDNGKLAESLMFKDGIKDGPWVQYYESGKKMAEGNYLNNQLDGEVTYFYSSGKPRSRGSYKRGLMDGVWYFFSSDLKVDHKEVWKLGRMMETTEKKEEDSK